MSIKNRMTVEEAHRRIKEADARIEDISVWDHFVSYGDGAPLHQYTIFIKTAGIHVQVNSSDLLAGVCEALQRFEEDVNKPACECCGKPIDK